MKQVDFIVVGLGLAGMAVVEELLKAEKTVYVVDKNKNSASKIAGGMYNPVVLKRFTMAWNADKQLPQSLKYYTGLERKLNIKINQPLPVFRRFYSVEEQNNWFEATDKPLLKQFLNPKIKKNINQHITGDYSFGEVYKTGIINTEKSLNTYWEKLKLNKNTEEGYFDFKFLKIKGNIITYKDVSAKQIIFCEGVSIKQNPYFNHLDIRANKGEYLIILSKELKLDVAVKSTIFIIPLGNDLYKVGASYDRDDQTKEPTTKKRIELENKLKQLITCTYTIVDQLAGFRPTTKDRKPYVGQHHTYKNLWICNGLGSRGVMTSPVVAKHLADFILKGTPIPQDIDAKRHL